MQKEAKRISKKRDFLHISLIHYCESEEWQINREQQREKSIVWKENKCLYDRAFSEPLKHIPNMRKMQYFLLYFLCFVPSFPISFWILQSIFMRSEMEHMQIIRDSPHGDSSFVLSLSLSFSMHVGFILSLIYFSLIENSLKNFYFCIFFPFLNVTN